MGVRYLNEDFDTKTTFDNNCIIFAMHDESFLFMKSNEGENPPVYVFNADGPGSEVRRCDNSFIECIIAHISSIVGLLPNKESESNHQVR